MLTLSDVNDNNIASLKVEGKLTRQDFDSILPTLEQVVEKKEPLHFFIELHDFTGMDLGAMKEDAKFDLKHKGQYGKIAIVGEKRWQEWATRFSDLLFDAPVRFYDKEESGSAWKWVNNGSGKS